MNLGRASRGLAGFACLLIALTSTSAIAAQAGTPNLKFTADTPVRVDALPKSEFDAIVAEATEIASQPRKTSVVALPARWRTLDRARLLALLSMPAYADIDLGPQGVLLDQAATWDLISFRRPSDAAALWKRLWPNGPNDKQDPKPNSNGIGYVPDPTWSPTAMAMSTIFACFPDSVWGATEDPVVWAVRSPRAWQWQNEQGWDGFRRCIPQGAFWDDTRPDKAGLDAVAAVLKSKFTDELFADGCSRPGPDGCLLVYQALFSLDQRNPQLPAILKVMEREFALDEPIELPAVSAPAAGEGPSPAIMQALDAPEYEALRRVTFLTLKLPVLLQSPTAWPPGELERTLEQAMQLAVVRARIQKLKTFRHQKYEEYFLDPWQWIDAPVESRLASNQRASGAAYARRDACALGELDVDGGTATFWQSYVVENIRLGQGHCELFHRLQLAQRYGAENSTQGRAPDAAMAPLQPIATRMMAGGELHELALAAVTEKCGTRTRTASNDPWQLCEEIAARATTQAAQEAAEERARIASLPPVDKLACADGTIARAAEALHFSAEPEFWDWNAACRLDPSHPGHAIVALTYQKGEENGGESVDDSESNFDLDVVVLDLKKDTVLARRHEPEAIESDAVRFHALGIDTGPYALARGRRAFGIWTSNEVHCYQCTYNTSQLMLYLQSGERIDPIFEAQLSESRKEDATDECPDLLVESTTALSTGPGRSHGLADLLLTTTTQVTAYGEDAAPAACLANSVDTVAMHFDGQGYHPPAGKQPE
jgi:hypothetical protein